MPSKIVVKVASPVRSAPPPPSSAEVETQPTKSPKRQQTGPPPTLTTVPPPQAPQPQSSSTGATAPTTGYTAPTTGYTASDDTLPPSTITYLTAWSTLPRHASTLHTNPIPSESELNQIMIDTGVTNVTLLTRWFVKRREEYWMERVAAAAEAATKMAAMGGAAEREGAVVDKKVTVAAEERKVTGMTRVEVNNVGAATANTAAASSMGWQHHNAAYLNFLSSSGGPAVPYSSHAPTTTAATGATGFPSMPVGGLNPMMAAALVGQPGVGGQGAAAGMYGNALSSRYNIAIAQAAAAARQFHHHQHHHHQGALLRQQAQAQQQQRVAASTGLELDTATAAAGLMGISKAVEGQIIVGDNKLPTTTTGTTGSSVGESRDAASISSRQASSPLQSREPAPSSSVLPNTQASSLNEVSTPPLLR